MTETPTGPDRLYVVHLPNGSRITCTDETKARDSLARHPGARFGWRPFPSPVKMPWIGKDDYVLSNDPEGVTATHTGLGVSGWGFDARDAYSAMLRAIREHLEAQTETALEA